MTNQLTSQPTNKLSKSISTVFEILRSLSIQIPPILRTSNVYYTVTRARHLSVPRARSIQYTPS
jgi:hypothetical protein